MESHRFPLLSAPSRWPEPHHHHPPPPPTSVTRTPRYDWLTHGRGFRGGCRGRSPQEETPSWGACCVCGSRSGSRSAALLLPGRRGTEPTSSPASLTEIVYQRNKCKALVLLLRLRIALCNCVTMETPRALTVLRRGVDTQCTFPPAKQTRCKVNKISHTIHTTFHTSKLVGYKRDE